MIWKITIVLFFMSKIGFSIFSWANIKFRTANSLNGWINLILAFIIKFL